jgi:gluconolactonase
MTNIESHSSEFNQLISADAQVETVAKGFIFTEGPLWDSHENRLLFSDIPADTIYAWSEKREPRSSAIRPDSPTG